MLPDLFLNYTNYFQPLNLFNYISFRTIGALLTALLISFIFGPSIISILKKAQKSPFEKLQSALGSQRKIQY